MLLLLKYNVRLSVSLQHNLPYHQLQRTILPDHRRSLRHVSVGNDGRNKGLGRLHVRKGPLKGQEHRVRRFDRHKRLALVAAGVPGCNTGLLASLEVLSKT